MLTLVKYPESILRAKAEPVQQMDKEIDDLIHHMANVMYLDDGVGLAAPQVGISKRVIVLDIGDGLKSVLNPEIIEKSKEEENIEEGCLSLPEIRVDVSRPFRIVVQGRNENDKRIQVEADGLLARVLQHEIDHLNGILIIDFASSVSRSLLKPKLKKLEKENK
jgi:peptide deformylase